MNSTITVHGVEASVGEEVELSGGNIDIRPETIRRSAWINPPRPDCLGDAFWLAGGLGVPGGE